MNDLAETVILNMCRGTGLKGMCGIPPVRGYIIRPLIDVTREEIEEYVDGHGLGYCSDLTNFEAFYSRNRIRLEVLPYLIRHINSGTVRHIAAMADLAAAADAHIMRAADDIQDGILRCETDRVIIASEKLKETDPAIAGELVRRAIDHITGSLKDVSMSHIDLVLELTEKISGRQIDLPYGLEAVRDYDSIVIRNHQGEADGTVRMEDQKLPEYRVRTFRFDKKSQIPKNRCTKWFDYDRISCGPVLRTRLPGDYMTIKGDLKKTVKRVFSDDKVSRDMRGNMLMFADEDHIIWIPGLDRISEAYKVRDDTVNILEISIDDAETFFR